MPKDKATLNLDQDPNNIHFGDSVSVTYEVKPNTGVIPGLEIEVLAADGTKLLYGGGSPVLDGFAGNMPYPFVLGPTTAWPSASPGDATITLKDFPLHGPSKVLATVTFHVQA